MKKYTNISNEQAVNILNAYACQDNTSTTSTSYMLSVVESTKEPITLKYKGHTNRGTISYLMIVVGTDHRKLVELPA
jgi:hypothetical protein